MFRRNMLSRLRKIITRLRSEPPESKRLRSIWTTPQLRAMPNWALAYGTPSPEDRMAVARFSAWQALTQPVALPWIEGTTINIGPNASLYRAIVNSGLYEPGTAIALKRSLSAGGVFIDIGANAGLFSVLGSRWLGAKGRVVAIEPSPRERAEIKANLALNHGGAPVTIVDAAVGDSVGSAKLRLAGSENAGLNTIGPAFAYDVPVEREIAVRLTTIDHLVKKLRLARVDAIKMDVEGAELKALLGARQTLTRFKPTLIIEVNHSALGPQGASVSSLQDYLEDLGYSLSIIDEGTDATVPAGRLPRDASCNLLATAR